MQINAINNQIFEAKKFRLPVRIVKTNNNPVFARDLYASKDTLTTGNFVREYDNPKAEEYFNKALNATHTDEKLRYLDLMGDYKIIDISLEQQFDKFIKMADKMP